MPYWQLYYHLVWSTRKREPILLPDLEPGLYSCLRGKAISLDGTVHAIGGVEDHVHVVVSIPPRIAVAAFVGQLKGASSHWVNYLSGYPAHLAWQEGYGAFSFGRRALRFVVRYALEQRQHHATGRLIPILEQSRRAPAGPPAGEPAGYGMPT
jgi:putative transposase